jgi:RNA polymerase sigma-70 factor (ECF subfamily)
MRRWLTRAAEATALRGQEPRNRFARWTARWFEPVPAVPEARFQDEREPYPRHWRGSPGPWPDDSQLSAKIVAAVEDLPATWRAVVVARDVHGRDADEVGKQLGLTSRQQRAILNRARARLRARLAEG